MKKVQITQDNSKLSFLVFSDDWGEHPSSCQHIFRYIAYNHKVIWVNTIGMRNPTLTWSDIKKATNKLSKMFYNLGKNNTIITGDSNNIEVCQPPMLPYSNFNIFRKINRIFVKRTVLKALWRNNIVNPIFLATVPNAADYIGLFDEKLLVYYCVDDFSEWPKLNRNLVQGMENSLIAKTNVFVATSQKLFQKLNKHNKKTFLLTHGVDYDFFSLLPDKEHNVLINIPKPRIGYYGLFDERSSQTLMLQLAEIKKDLNFVVTGPVVANIEKLKKVKNLHFTGPVPYQELPALIKGFDILFIPYLANNLMESVSPLKLKEYLSTGKPIISTPIPEVFSYNEYIYIARTIDEWVLFLNDLLKHNICTKKKIRRNEFVSESWSNKAKELIKICREQS